MWWCPFYRFSPIENFWAFQTVILKPGGAGVRNHDQGIFSAIFTLFVWNFIWLVITLLVFASLARFAWSFDHSCHKYCLPDQLKSSPPFNLPFHCLVNNMRFGVKRIFVALQLWSPLMRYNHQSQDATDRYLQLLVLLPSVNIKCIHLGNESTKPYKNHLACTVLEFSIYCF